jgi:hypothetical protein
MGPRESMARGRMLLTKTFVSLTCEVEIYTYYYCSRTGENVKTDVEKMVVKDV